jgi:hypothetical protein
MRALETPRPLYHLSGCNAPMLLTTVLYGPDDPMHPRDLRTLAGDAMPLGAMAVCPACKGDIQLVDLIAQLREAA